MYFAKNADLLAVAKCESGMRHYDKNGKVLRGYVDNDDIGAMQINQRYHGKQAKKLGLDIYDLLDNLKYAEYLYEKEGLQPWSASKPCWSAE